MNIILRLLVTVFCNTFLCIYAWGPDGHHLIVRLAQSQLQESASEWIRSLTPWHWNGDLSAMASWADNIIYSTTNPTGYDNWQWSRTLHYLNIPDWSCEYEAKRDCINDNCIAGAIKNYTKRLETEDDEVQLKEALYFLIHFIGDMYQPLHMGFKNDRGGNDILGYFMNQTYQTNLHFVWDSDLLTTRLQRDFQENVSLYYDHIYQIMLNQSSLNDDNDIDELIKENIYLVCSQIYLDENNARMNSSVNFYLGDVYYERNWPVVEKQLVRGGRQLGVLLNRLANRRLQKPVDNRNKLCSGTIALIVILCIEAVLAIIAGIIMWFRHKNQSLARSSPVVLSKT